MRLYESELDKIFKYIFNDLINNFDDIKNNLFNVSAKVANNCRPAKFFIVPRLCRPI